MNKWQKLGLAVGMGTAVVTTSHIINKFIFESATINNYTGKTVKHTYSFIMFWIAVGMIIGLIFTGSMFWHIVIIIALIIIGYNMFCH